MSSSADLVFALPAVPKTAAVGDVPEAWRQTLEAMGAEVTPLQLEAGDHPPDVAIVGPDEVGLVVRVQPAAVIVVGRVRRRPLRRAGYSVRQVLAIPNTDGPEALVPTGDAGLVRFLLRRSPPKSLVKRVRNLAAPALLALGVDAGRAGRLVLGLRQDAQQPFLLQAAGPLGLPQPARWALIPAQGDVLTRGAILVFESGARDPSWAVKFVRVAGYTESFDLDRDALKLVEQAGPVARAHAPRLLGAIECEELNASVESAASGQTLLSFLTGSAAHSEKLRLIDRIATWILELGASTQGGPGSAASELSRLGRYVLPGWKAELGGTQPPPELADIGSVFQHNDLGPWNIVISPGHEDSGGFVALDWESARAAGLPLWDLLYFLQEALPALDGVTGLGSARLEARTDHAVRLFRGELDSSAVLFRWIREYVRALAIPTGAVGPLATLMMLDYGLFEGQRNETAQAHSHGGALATVANPLAHRWLADPALGWSWRAWADPEGGP